MILSISHLSKPEMLDALRHRYEHLCQQQTLAKKVGDGERWGSYECDIRIVKRLIDQIDAGKVVA